jgi:hypothetical protein
MVSDVNELASLGRERDRFKAAGFVTLVVLATAFTGFGLVAVVLLSTNPRAPATGWLWAAGFLVLGGLLIWAARIRRASYIGLHDNGFAIMKREGVPRDTVRWDDVTDVKHHVHDTFTNGIKTESKYTCTVHVAGRTNAVNLTNKDFKGAGDLGRRIQSEYKRRRAQ